MKRKIDLHTHSDKSDGTLSPAELARQAKAEGLCAVALTDHDTDSGVGEFIAECDRLGIEGIGGIEISTDFPRLLHIVGLYQHGDEYERIVAKLKNARLERNLKMMQRLQEEFGITKEEILSGTGAESCGRIHMANAIVKRGYAQSVGEAFERYLKRGRLCYVEKASPSPEEGVRLIKDCGGIAVWAHPVSAADTEAEMLEIARRMKTAGLDAMECLYNNFTPEQGAMCKRVAEKAGLLQSGGSDFHGANKPEVRLGEVSEGFVPYEILEKLKQVM